MAFEKEYRFPNEELKALKKLIASESADDFSNVDALLSALQSNVNNLAPKYLVYAALITQSGTDAPVATVLENTLNGTPVWSRANMGDYRLTLAGAFTTNKTAIVFGNITTTTAGGFLTKYDVVAGTTSEDVVYVSSVDNTGSVDNVIGSNGTPFYIEVRVYL